MTDANMDQVVNLLSADSNSSGKTNSCSVKYKEFGRKKGKSNKHKKSKGKKHCKTNKNKLKNTLQMQSISQIAGMDSNWMQSYAHTMAWQQKQQIAYWKSKAVSLEYENKILHSIIRNMHLEAQQATGILHSKQTSTSYTNATSTHPNLTQANIFHGNSTQANISHGNSTQANSTHNYSATEDEHDSEEESEGYEMVVSEEWIQFLEQNAKHKRDLQKEKEEKNKLPDSYLEDVHKMEQPPSASENDERDEVLKLLYGDSVLKVLGLETCMQLNFDKKKIMRKSVLWPNIPLKL